MCDGAGIACGDSGRVATKTGARRLVAQPARVVEHAVRDALRIAEEILPLEHANAGAEMANRVPATAGASDQKMG